jgi:hypothetical protein
MGKYPILTLEVYDEDPMEGIRVFYEEWKGLDSDHADLSERNFTAWHAIKKAVERK